MSSHDMLMFAIYCEREAGRAAEMAHNPVVSSFGNWWHHADDKGEYLEQCKYFSDLARLYRASLMIRAQRGGENA